MLENNNINKSPFRVCVCAFFVSLARSPARFRYCSIPLFAWIDVVVVAAAVAVAVVCFFFIFSSFCMLCTSLSARARDSIALAEREV